MQAMLPSLEWTKNQVDRLGDRLRKGDISGDDLRLLDSYRRSFSDAYENVVGQIRDRLELEPTGRPAKSTTSIIDKLQRESVRLSQVQDIGGCRLTVADITTQDEVVAQIETLFDKVSIVDRRDHPSHGYRAVHMIVDCFGKLIEIQIRTALQHRWAEVSEKISDVVDAAIKYGEGDPKVLSFLTVASDEIMVVESLESELHRVLAIADQTEELSESTDEKIAEARELLRVRRKRVVKLVNLIGDIIPRGKGPKDDLSN
jgi:putative GTP pyrophosphokinase